MHLTKILTLLILVGIALAKKRSKLHSQLQNQARNYKDVILLHYGSVWEGHFFNGFQEIAKHFNYDPQPLKQCQSMNLQEKSCLLEIKSKLDLIRRPTIVIIINHDKNLINTVDLRLFDYFNKYKEGSGLMTNRDPDEFGLNIIGDYLVLLSRVKASLESGDDLIEESEIDLVDLHFKPYETHEEASKIGTNSPYQVLSVMDTSNSNVPLMLLLKGDRDILGHILSMFYHFESQLNPEPPLEIANLATLPEISVCVSIPDKTTFLEEFLYHFTNQDYAKSRMKLFVTSINTDYLMKTKDYMKDFDYKSNSVIEADVVQGRLDCIKHFQQDYSSNILFISQLAILENHSTLSVMAAQNLAFASAKLITNHKRPKLHQFCQFGWNRTYDEWVAFPNYLNYNAFSGEYKGHQLFKGRYLRGYNYGLFQTKNVNGTFTDGYKFWVPMTETAGEKLTLGNDAFDESLSVTEDSVGIVQDVEEGTGYPKTRVYAIRYLYMIQRPIMNQLSLLELSAAKNETHFDALMSHFVQDVTDLTLICDQIYGSIINLFGIRTSSSNPEFYRIYENHNLWMNRYISENVTKWISYDKEIAKRFPQYSLKKADCYDTYELEMFTPNFTDTLLEEYDANPSIFSDYILEEDFTSIAYFYIHPALCGPFLGHIQTYQSSYFFMSDYSPTSNQGQEDAENLQYADSDVNMFLPLNQYDIDYQGGGWHFVRYNCSQSMNKGKILITPGDLTHSNYVNPVTSGHFKFLTGKINGGTKIRFFLKYRQRVVPGFVLVTDNKIRNE